MFVVDQPSRAGRLWRAAVSATAAVSSMAFLAPAPAFATSSATSARLAGSDRYGTAGAIAQAKFASGTTTAVVASGLDFPDALASSFLAGNQGAAILLTDPATVPANTLSALSTLKVKNVVIVGGTAAVSQAVQDQLASTSSTSSAGGSLTVSRIGGATRFDTDQFVDTAPGTTVGSLGSKKTAIVATGLNFPDALAAGAPAYKDHLPIVITDPSTLSSQARSTLQDLGIQQVLIVGGDAAVSQTVQSQIAAMGITVAQRLAGVNRNDTASQLATYEVANLGFSYDEVTLARGDDFADALAGAQYAGDPKPILLTGDPNTLSTETSTELSTNASSIKKITAFGGTAAISDSTLSAAVTAAGGSSTPTSSTPPPTVSSTGPSGSFPALASASLLGPNNFGGSQPTIVKFTFTKSIQSSLVTAANCAGLRLIGWNLTGAKTAAATSYDSGDPASCTADSDGMSVDNQYASSVNLAQYTIAVADAGSVTGTSPALVNPLGSVPFSGVSSSTSGSGSLPNPLLTSVSVLSDNTVTYTFSQPVTGAAPTAAKFGYVTSDGTSVNGAAAATPNAASVNVSFPAASPPVSNGVRFFVQAGAVTSSASGGGFTNPEGAVGTSGSSSPSVTDRPSLTSVSRVSGSDGFFVFTFDHPVSFGAAGSTLGDFEVYLSNSSAPGTGCTAAGGTSVGQPSADSIEIGFAGPAAGCGTKISNSLAWWGAVTDNSNVASPPTAGAVTQNGSPTTEFNTVGGLAITSAHGFVAGSGHGPLLTKVAGTASVDTVTYTFSASVVSSGADVPTLADFFVVTPSGTLAAPGAGASLAASGSTVTVNFGATSIIGDVGAGVLSQLGGSTVNGGFAAFPAAVADASGHENAPGDLPMTVT